MEGLKTAGLSHRAGGIAFQQLSPAAPGECPNSGRFS